MIFRNCSGEHIFHENKHASREGKTRSTASLASDYFSLNMYSLLSVTEKSKAFGGALMNSYDIP